MKSKTDGSIVGVRVKAKILKNKMAPPLRMTEFDIIYGWGVNNLGCIVDAAEERGILTRNGSWYSYEGNNIGQGREKTIEALASDLDFAEEIKKRIIDQ